MPSSLTRVLPFVLEFSSRLPVSVCGTGTSTLFSSFSRRCGFIDFASLVRSPSALRLSTGVLHCLPTLRLGRAFPSARFDYPSVSLLHTTCVGGTGLTLGGRTFPRKPQTFDGEVSRLPLATYAGILSSIQSTAPSGTASARMHCSPTDSISTIPKLRCQVLAP